MRELFVYYRVKADAATPALAAVHRVHQTLRQQYPSLVARLLTRSGDGGTPTWMETYAMAPAGIDAGTEAAIAESALGLASFIDGLRHVEAFDAER